MRKETREILDNLIDLQDRTKELEQINEEHRKINGELRKTINEAIDYINNINGGIVCSNFNPYLDYLLNILQGSDE